MVERVGVAGSGTGGAFVVPVVPMVQAPMAGGVATPGLVSAVSEAGALGFLAGGYLSADRLAEQVAAVRGRTDRPFGVNLFVPGERGGDDALAAYRAELRPEAERFGVTLPEGDLYDRDDYDAKVRGLVADPVTVVSFTFGLPGAEEVAALRAAGSALVVTVTSVAEAEAAVAVGADALCVQGPEAGGHRSTHRVDDEPGTAPLPELVAGIARRVRVPLVAAGGLADGRDIAAVLQAGAVAAQLGTAYLRTDEAGTSRPHRDALVDPAFTATTVTRAFTGRPARALRSDFTEAHGAHAPRAYPQVHRLTAPLRTAAVRAGAPEAMALWAGTGFRHARTGPAAGLTRALWDEARSATG
ncbi:nitronate monooxygenase [Streptomyces otsuchiensis]|uniref:nitronate monooxygenase n=1 Tax=Streptomyces otsuchiensis TaxID=2681388 RepID=UPI001030A554|nr:nitronate monooxygenase [Streptomyces otsuchiensis]